MIWLTECNFYNHLFNIICSQQTIIMETWFRFRPLHFIICSWKLLNSKFCNNNWDIHIQQQINCSVRILIYINCEFFPLWEELCPLSWIFTPNIFLLQTLIHDPGERERERQMNRKPRNPRSEKKNEWDANSHRTDRVRELVGNLLRNY